MSEVTKDLSDLIKSRSQKATDIDIDSDDINEQLKKLAATRYSSDTVDRKWLAKWTALIVSLWLGAVMFVLFYNQRIFHLNDSVLVALLGTTTLNVLGLSFIVLRGHFQSGSK